jgi:phospholipase C
VILHDLLDESLPRSVSTLCEGGDRAHDGRPISNDTRGNVMTTRIGIRKSMLGALAAAGMMLGATTTHADGNLNNVHHIIIFMQENHSYDNYFGVLGYVPNSPYHNVKGHSRRGCDINDNTCVDGLTCKTSVKTGQLVCRNKNPSNLKGRVAAFHEDKLCTGPDLDHSWMGSHAEGNFKRLNAMLRSSPNNGFVRVNAETEGPEQVTEHDTMGFYDDTDLPFYYDIAKNFAMSDRYFCAVIGQTFPNRSYFLAGTSFGHLTTNEIFIGGGYKPITGTIFDRLDAAGVSWTDYFSDIPYSGMFAISPGHQKNISQFLADATAGTLPAVSFVDGSVFATQSINGSMYETDEHPPANIRAGQYVVSQVINALRNGPNWSDSILFWTYDEHGGFYDHVMPPAASQGGFPTPDGIAPGQCADLSNPPASQQPGGGTNCAHSSTVDAPGVCPTFSPTSPYPEECATFDQLGFRVPLVAVSPFSKPHYVSHITGSHASFLALLEKRFSLPSLTARDAVASTFEEMFDFDNSPSLNTAIGTAPLPEQPPAVNPGDPGCPF